MNKNLAKLKDLTDRLIDRDFLLKKRQDMLLFLLKSSPSRAVVWTCDTEFIIIDGMGYNDRIGIGYISDVIGDRIIEIMGFRDSEIKFLDLALKGEDVNFSSLHRNRTLVHHCTKLEDYEGKIVGVIGVTWDMTCSDDCVGRILKCNLLNLSKDI